MRRRDRLMAEADALVLLEQGELCVLSLAEPNGTPYGVPVNYCYVREDHAIYFHCANKGRKMDMLLSNPSVSVAVMGRMHIDARNLTTRYESVIVSGRAELVQDEAEKVRALDLLCAHLTPGIAWRKDTGCRHLAAVAVVRIAVESVTGKKNAEPRE